MSLLKFLDNLSADKAEGFDYAIMDPKEAVMLAQALKEFYEHASIHKHGCFKCEPCLELVQKWDQRFDDEIIR